MRERIHQIMKMKSVNAAEFADLMQIKRPGLSHILTGRNNPSLDFVIKLKETFPEINLEWLLYGRGPMTQIGDGGILRNQTSVEQPDLFSVDNLEKGVVLPERVSKNLAGIASSDTLHSAISHENDSLQMSGSIAGNSELKKENPVRIGQDERNFSLSKKAVRMIMLYEDGSFEAFDRSV